MEFVAQKGELIVMEDTENYMVLATLEYEGVGYLRLIKTGEVLFDVDYEPDLKKEVYVQEIVDDNEEDYYLEFVTDEALIEKLREL